MWAPSLDIRKVTAMKILTTIALLIAVVAPAIAVAGPMAESKRAPAAVVKPSNSEPARHGLKRTHKKSRTPSKSIKRGGHIH
jgi:Ni/Co efflux regulator RcnB